MWDAKLLPLSNNTLETLILEGKEMERAVDALQTSLSSADIATGSARHGLIQLGLLFDQLKKVRRDLDHLDDLIVAARNGYLSGEGLSQ